MKKFSFLLCVLYCSSSFLFAQPGSHQPESALTRAIRHIPVSSPPKHQVLILGTPHFNLAQNTSDWKPVKEMDIMSPEKQQEIQDLLAALVKFKPTRICLEWEPKNDSFWNARYQLYRQNRLTLGRHETYQLAFRLAQMLQLDSLHCIDNKPKQSESLLEIEDWDKYVLEASTQTDLSTYDSLNQAFNKYVDSVKYTMPLSDYYLLVNSDEMKQQNKRLWFTGPVHVGNKTTYAGADLTGTWYQRNTRIFSNVKKLCGDRPERILVLYGMSHAFILEEIFRASQQFEVVPVSAMLR